MRALILIGLPLLLSSPASALCRCVCNGGGVAQPVCGPSDLDRPICQDLCPDPVRPAQVTRPLAGGRPQFEPVRPFNPAPNGLSEQNSDLNVNPNGMPLGTPSTLSGGPGYGATGAVQSGASGASGR